jgi:hypothetical protein
MPDEPGGCGQGLTLAGAVPARHFRMARRAAQGWRAYQAWLGIFFRSVPRTELNLNGHWPWEAGSGPPPRPEGGAGVSPANRGLRLVADTDFEVGAQFFPFARSATMNSPNSLAPEPTTSAKSGVIRSINTGSLQTALTAASTLSQISAGLPLRTATPENANAAKPGTVSAIGAKSDASGQRVSVEITKSPNAAGAGLWNDRRGVVDNCVDGANQPIVESWCTVAIRWRSRLRPAFARKVRRRADTR